MKFYQTLRADKARYEYDTYNRNTKVETFNGNIQINHYDAEGLRHEIEENGKLVSFIFRGDEIVAEESQEDRYAISGQNRCLHRMQKARELTITMHLMK